MKRIIIICFSFFLLQTTFAQVKSSTTSKPAAVPKERLVQITTDMGIIIVKLYNTTPMHRDNFIKLVKEGFYDSLLFHRVIDGFMIQGGDPDSKNAPDSAMLGSGSAPGDRIPAEFQPNLIHKKGALAAARDDNPQKASSNCQFYIVQGQKYDDVQINQMECNARSSNPAFTYTATQRTLYKTIGGTPFLDQNYTVFGEVTKGLEVIDKIAKTPKDANDRPLTNVHMKMKMLN